MEVGISEFTRSLGLYAPHNMNKKNLDLDLLISIKIKVAPR
jgi:hypothetical protein